jgi:hypothetical protein
MQSGKFMAMARLNAEVIIDWQSFHEACREAFGFPDFYGMNMNAWIDCLSYLDEGDGMSRFHLAAGEMLHVEIPAAESFNARLPEIFGALVACSAAVNRRYVEAGKPPALSLVFV